MTTTATTTTTRTVRAKEFHFPLTVEWLGERRVAARVEGKPAIEITPPPVFRGTDPAVWSPEDFFVAAAASCLAVTFTGLAARAGLGYTSLKVGGDGVAGRRSDDRFGFTRLLLRLEVETDANDSAHARALAEEAERTCLVSASLDLPVETTILVRHRPES
jgi:organic hydroperoxide reductase OsmC/OhrA